MTSRRAWRIGTAVALGALSAALLWGPSAQAGDMRSNSCAASHLSAKQTGSGAGMSQPFSVITITNTGSSTCSLSGYPTITAAWTKSGKKAIRVTPGNLGNMSDPGPSHVALAPGGKAWFAIGAATAYDPPLVTFRRIAFSAGGGSVLAKLSLPATAPTGKAFPLGVTAYAAGSGPQTT